MRPAVIALFVETGRVNHPHVVRQEGRKICFIDIIDNFDGFCVPWACYHLLIAGVRAIAIGITWYRIDHAIHALHIGL